MNATVTHSVPGRMRIRVDGSRPERSQALNALRAGVGDRAEVHTDARTGSALLTYDPGSSDPDSLIEAVRESHEAFEALAPPAEQQVVDRSLSTVAGAIQTRFSKANRSVLHATQGHVDLRVLFPVTLGGLAVGQLFRRGAGLRDAPWYVLAYYAFDSYLKLHYEHSASTPVTSPNGQ